MRWRDVLLDVTTWLAFSASDQFWRGLQLRDYLLNECSFR